MSSDSEICLSQDIHSSRYFEEGPVLNSMREIYKVIIYLAEKTARPAYG